MKWIGQHIWDLTSRFRNDVYLENLTEVEQEFTIQVAADGKLTKSTAPSERSRIQVRNDEGSVIPAGAPLYSKGEIGGSNRIKVGICVSSDPAKMPCVGIAEFEMNTSNTKDSFAITQGVYNTNISGFTGLTEGSILYVNGGVAPHLTPTKPTNGSLIQNVGIVLKAGGGGTICQGLLVSAIGRTNDVPWPLYVDHTTQRVGIGTASPSTKLHIEDSSHVYSTLQSTGANTEVAHKYRSSTLTSGYYWWTGLNNYDKYQIAYGTIFDNAGTALCIDTSGNVGIGTTSPAYKLDVSGDSAVGARISTSGFANLDLVSSRTSGNLGGVRFKQDIDAYQTAEFLGLHGGGFDWKTGNGTALPSSRMTLNTSGNVGIGTTTPTSKLHVIGDARIQGNLTVNGTYTQIDTDVNTTEQWLVTNDGTGPAAVINQLGTEDIFDVQDDGTSVFYIEDGGNIGIGTTTPNEKLEVDGNIRLANSGKLYLWQTHDANYLQYYRWELNSSLTAYINNAGSGGVALKTAGNTRLFVDSSGNVGIGTTSPEAKLTIKSDPGNTNQPTRITNSSTDAHTGLFLNGTGNATGEKYGMQFGGYNEYSIGGIFGVLDSTGGSTSGDITIDFANGTSAGALIEKVRFTHEGNVGIGTASPGYKLEVNGTGSFFGNIRSGGGTLWSDSNGGVQLGYNSSDATGYLTTYYDSTSVVIGAGISQKTGITINGQSASAGNQITFRVGNAERIRIDSSGNVGIGTASPTEKLTIEQTSAGADVYPLQLSNASTTDSTGVGIVFNVSSNTGYDNARILVERTDGDATGEMSFWTVSGNSGTISERMRIDKDGNVGIGTTSPDSLLHVSADVSSGGVTNTGTITIEGRPAGYLGDDIATIDFHNTGVKYADIRMERGNAGNDSQLVFSTSDTGTLNDALIINEVGNVGIGNTSPGKLLDVNGTFRASGEAFLTGGFDITAAGRFRDGIAVNFNTNRTARIFTDSNDLIIQQGEDDKDIIFKCDDGSGGTTPYLTIDGSNGYIRLEDDRRLTIGSGNDLQLKHSSGASSITNFTGAFNIVQEMVDGDIIFSSDDGSGSTTEYFRLDGSSVANVFSEKIEVYKADATANPRVSIGRSSGEAINFDVEDRIARIYHKQDETTGFHDLRLTVDSDTSDDKNIKLGFRDADGSNESIKFTLDEDGNIGIGTTTPSARLEVSSDSSYSSDLNILSISGTKTGGTAVTNVKGINVDIGSNDHVAGHDITNLYGAYINNNASGGSATVINNWYGVYVPAVDADRVANSVSAYFGDNVGIGTTSPSEKLDVVGNIAVSGSVQKQISTTHHTFTTVNGGSAAQDYWVPFIGTNELAAPNVTHRTIAPYGGILKKAIVHSTAAFGSSAQVRFHRIDNGTASVFTNLNDTDDVTTNVTGSLATAYTSTEFIFTTGNTFSTGDQVGVSFVRDNTAQGDVAMTLVWEYELF